ncbi:hypothetical protein BC827DRAFT_1181507 [Russula dissimulans]|nr:hypothetical protein BC827DRAFT_1181507 [Russula dissimulans]
MREMWSHDDIVIRITSRSICALLAKRLLKKPRLRAAELSWLHEVTGEEANMILNSPDIAVVSGKNIKVFVSRVLEHDLPNEHATYFAKTLAILFDAGVHIPFDRTKFRNSLSALIRSVEAEDGNTKVANKLRQIFHDILEPPTPSASSPAAPTPSTSALTAPALPTPAPSPMPTPTPLLAPPTFPQAPGPAPAFPTPTSVQP